MPSKALVLGAGGRLGLAWQSGLLAGLARTGVDLSKADFVLGTSAGAITGARLVIAKAADQLFKSSVGQPGSQELSPLRSRPALRASGPSDQRGAVIGARALSAQTKTEAEYIATFSPDIAQVDAAWPRRAFACVAVDTLDGSPHVFDASSGVPLSHAVAASCSSPGLSPPITIAGQRFMDGCVRSETNADFAQGSGLVVIVSVGGLTKDTRDRAEADLIRERERLEAEGSVVLVLHPDRATRDVFGADLMDPSRQYDAVRAGLAQAWPLSAELEEVWNSEN